MQKINKQALINALRKLEHNNKNIAGYEVKEILGILNVDANKIVEKQTRGKLRSLISKIKYPEFKTAGNEDIVYCPGGKNSGKYRLSNNGTFSRKE